jgi:hypothetical protein
MARIPESEGMYCLAGANTNCHDHAHAAVTKMTLIEAHRRLGHITCPAVKYMVSSGMVTQNPFRRNHPPKLHIVVSMFTGTFGDQL